MTPTQEAAMRQALEALETPIHEQSFMQKQNAITALKAALAEPVQDHFPDATKMVQEPVQETEMRRCPRCWEPMFPPQRKPLTDEKLDELAMDEDGLPNSHIEFARAIERAHGIKE